jgi:ABC-type phosphate/phosphonate transport system substrate-binding protein
VLADFPKELAERWTEALLAMNYNDLRWRELMDAEGLKRWVRADKQILAQYQPLFDAIEYQGLRQTLG